MNEKARQRNELAFQFGVLIQPLVELSSSSITHTAHDYRIACAKVLAGVPRWSVTVKEFTTFAPDIVMEAERRKIINAVSPLLHDIPIIVDRDTKNNNLEYLNHNCVKILEDCKTDFYSHLSNIPIEWEPEIFAANTPFTAYMKIKDAINVASTRLLYFDRYLRADFFELYLRDVKRSIDVQLVTTKGRKDYGVSGVIAVSELTKKEFQSYKLIEVEAEDVHDRNLIVDDNIFFLGPSINQAGSAPTNFGPAGNSAEALLELMQIIGNGKVIH